MNTVQNWKHSLEHVLFKYTNQNCDDKNTHKFLLLDLFLQVITIIAIEKNTADNINDSNLGSICDKKPSKEDCSNINCEDPMIKTHRIYSAESLLSDSYKIVLCV